MRATHGKLFNGTGTGFTGSPTATFKLEGGRYVVCMVGTSGTLSLEMLGPDGTTFIICKDIAGNAITNGSLATASFNTVDLPPGQYVFAGTSPVAAFAQITRCPGE